MVELGHFKELNSILKYIYYTKDEDLIQPSAKTEMDFEETEIMSHLGEKEKNLLRNAIDLNEELMSSVSLEERKKLETEDDTITKKKRKRNKEGRITIVCSATLILDTTGRFLPKKLKAKKDVKIYDRQKLLFKKIKFRKDPKLINLSTDSKVPEELNEFKITISTLDQKDLYLYSILKDKFAQEQSHSAIIFTNSIFCCKRVTSLLKILFPETLTFCLHGKMVQKQRLSNLEGFKNPNSQKKNHNLKGRLDKNSILICTDVGARGLDIPQVETIIHYQLPSNGEVYIHRCGRTARINRPGSSIAFLNGKDIPNFNSILQTMSSPDSKIDIPDYPINFAKLNSFRELMTNSKKYEKHIFLERNKKKNKNWVDRMARDADILVDETMKKELKYEDTADLIAQKEDNDLKLKEDKKQDGRKRGILEKKLEKKQKKEERILFNSMKQRHKQDLRASEMKTMKKSSFLTPEMVEYLNSASSKDHEIPSPFEHYSLNNSKRKSNFKKSRYKNRRKKHKK